MSNKKIFTILLIIILIILLVASFFISDKETSSSSTKSNDTKAILTNAQKEANVISEDEKKEFTNIDLSQYLQMYNSNENNLIFIGRPTCSYCQIAEPIIHKLAKEYDLTIYYLNTDNFTQDDKAAFKESDEYFQNGYGTPMLLVVSNTEIVDIVDGLTDTAHYIDFLKKNNYIK